MDRDGVGAGAGDGGGNRDDIGNWGSIPGWTLLHKHGHPCAFGIPNVLMGRVRGFKCGEHSCWVTFDGIGVINSYIPDVGKGQVAFQRAMKEVDRVISRMGRWVRRCVLAGDWNTEMPAAVCSGVGNRGGRLRGEAGYEDRVAEVASVWHKHGMAAVNTFSSQAEMCDW